MHMEVYLLNIREEGTSPSGPKVSFFAFTVHLSRNYGITSGYKIMSFRYVARRGSW